MDNQQEVQPTQLPIQTVNATPQNKRKRIVIIVIIAILILLVTVVSMVLLIGTGQKQSTNQEPAESGQAEKISLYFAPSSVDYRNSEPITAPLFINTNGTQVNDMIISIEYDPQVFTSLMLLQGPQATSTSPYYDVLDSQIRNDKGIASFTVRKKETVDEVPATAEVLQLQFVPKVKAGINTAIIKLSENTSFDSTNGSTPVLKSFDLIFN